MIEDILVFIKSLLFKIINYRIYIHIYIYIYILATLDNSVIFILFKEIIKNINNESMVSLVKILLYN